METTYYINSNDKVYDVNYLEDTDIVKKYIIKHYTEISYDEIDQEYKDIISDENNYILRYDYYPELCDNLSDIDYKLHLIDNRIRLNKKMQEYSDILYQAISERIAITRKYMNKVRIKDFMIKLYE